MWDHRIVDRVSIFGDVEIFLDNTPCIREERPVGADSTPIFIRLSNIVGTDCDQAAIANLDLTMELNKSFSLPPVFRAETSAAEDENHRVLSLQFGELPPLSGMVGELIVGEDARWNNISSHMKSSNSRTRLTRLAVTR